MKKETIQEVKDVRLSQDKEYQLLLKVKRHLEKEIEKINNKIKKYE